MQERSYSSTLFWKDHLFRTPGKRKYGFPCSVIRWIKEIYDRFTTQKACNKAVRTNPEAFFYIPYRFKTQEMCIKAVEKDPSDLRFVYEKPCVLEILLIILKRKVCVKTSLKKIYGG